MNEKERLLALMKAEGLNAKQFTREAGISAATMSNIINGRNNPSLEVMQKVLNRFRNVSTMWLILGVGSMYNEKSDSQDDIFVQNPASESMSEQADVLPASYIYNNVRTRTHARNGSEPDNAQADSNDVSGNSKQVARVLIFYTDGTFDELRR